MQSRNRCASIHIFDEQSTAQRLCCSSKWVESWMFALECNHIFLVCDVDFMVCINFKFKITSFKYIIFVITKSVLLLDYTSRWYLRIKRSLNIRLNIANFLNQFGINRNAGQINVSRNEFIVIVQQNWSIVQRREANCWHADLIKTNVTFLNKFMEFEQGNSYLKRKNYNLNKGYYYSVDNYHENNGGKNILTSRM